MSDRRVTLDTAGFLDSRFARDVEGLRPSDLQDVVRTCVEAMYDAVGKAPRLLDGDDVRALLREHLPSRFGRKDERVAHVVEVLRAFFAFVAERDVVVHEFEIRRQLDADEEEFVRLVRSGVPQAGGAPARSTRPFVHRGDKVGRNDPCPCGSGKKFKACCAKLG